MPAASDSTQPAAGTVFRWIFSKSFKLTRCHHCCRTTAGPGVNHRMYEKQKPFRILLWQSIPYFLPPQRTGTVDLLGCRNQWSRKSHSLPAAARRSSVWTHPAGLLRYSAQVPVTFESVYCSGSQWPPALVHVELQRSRTDEEKRSHVLLLRLPAAHTNVHRGGSVTHSNCLHLHTQGGKTLSVFLRTCICFYFYGATWFNQ